MRLTELAPDLLQMVDDGKIAMRPAVELSYLNDIEQQDLIAQIAETDATPSHAQAIKMRNFSKEGKLNPEVIESIMLEEKPNQRPKISFKYEELRQYMPSSISYICRHQRPLRPPFRPSLPVWRLRSPFSARRST